MTTTNTVKKPEMPAQPNVDGGKPGGSAPVDKEKPPVVTLEHLSKEMKMTPRDARMLLRLAAKQTKLYPTLGKDHVARQPWQWTSGSKALEEARKALAPTPETQG